jgi:hypothetical protein
MTEASAVGHRLGGVVDGGRLGNDCVGSGGVGESIHEFSFSKFVGAFDPALGREGLELREPKTAEFGACVRRVRGLGAGGR